MSNLEIYNKAFMDSFGITEAELKNLEYQMIENWDRNHLQVRRYPVIILV